MEISVRTATTDDADFLKDLFYEVRAPEFEASGLVGVPLMQLLAQQYLAMRTHYDMVYAEAVYSIVELDGQRIGYQATIELDTLHLIDIALTTRVRGQGIGTALMKGLQAEATALGKPMSLTVEKFNPALRLYERLGFKPHMDSDFYLRMRWVG